MSPDHPPPNSSSYGFELKRLEELMSKQLAEAYAIITKQEKELLFIRLQRQNLRAALKEIHLQSQEISWLDGA